MTFSIGSASLRDALTRRSGFLGPLFDFLYFETNRSFNLATKRYMLLLIEENSAKLSEPTQLCRMFDSARVKLITIGLYPRKPSQSFACAFLLCIHGGASSSVLSEESVAFCRDQDSHMIRRAEKTVQSSIKGYSLKKSDEKFSPMQTH